LLKTWGLSIKPVAIIDFDSVWMRIQTLTRWTAYAELAEFMKIDSSSVSGAKRKANMPIEWLYAIALSFKCNMNWLFTGEGSMYVVDTPETVSQAVGEERPPVYSAGAKPIPADVEAVFEAFMEVMTSDVAGTKLALTQNTYEFRDKVRLHKEIAEMKDDMAAIKRRLFAEPREDDFKTQEAVGEKHRAGGEN
jgi:hypothetical protein